MDKQSKKLFATKGNFHQAQSQHIFPNYLNFTHKLAIMEKKRSRQSRNQYLAIEFRGNKPPMRTLLEIDKKYGGTFELRAENRRRSIVNSQYDPYDREVKLQMLLNLLMFLTTPSKK